MRALEGNQHQCIDAASDQFHYGRRTGKEATTMATRTKQNMGNPSQSRELMMRNLLLITLSVLLLAPAAGARSPERSEQAWDNLKKLRAGEKIEVVDYDMGYLSGKFLSVSGRGILLEAESDKQQVLVPRRDVLRVITRRPSDRLKNGLAGLGWGALGGLAVLLGEGHSEMGGEALMIVPALAVIGAVGGALSTPEMTVYHAAEGRGSWGLPDVDASSAETAGFEWTDTANADRPSESFSDQPDGWYAEQAPEVTPVVYEVVQPRDAGADAAEQANSTPIEYEVLDPDKFNQ
jgi:hypothetical protein